MTPTKYNPTNPAKTLLGQVIELTLDHDPTTNKMNPFYTYHPTTTCLIPEILRLTDRIADPIAWSVVSILKPLTGSDPTPTPAVMSAFCHLAVQVNNGFNDLTDLTKACSNLYIAMLGSRPVDPLTAESKLACSLITEFISAVIHYPDPNPLNPAIV